MNNLSCSRLLYNLLSSTRTNLVSSEIISFELNQNKDLFYNFFAYFKKSKITITKNLNSQEFSQDDFLVFLSKYLDLDEIISKRIFLLFMQYNSKLSPLFLELQLKSESGRLEIFSQIEKFYFEEKLFLISSLSYLLSHFDLECHPYHAVYLDFVAPFYDNYNFIYKIRDQYFFLTEEIRDLHIGVNKIKKYSTEIMLQNLILQYKLLELMMLYYRHIIHLPEDLLILFKHFKEQGFGKRILSKKYFSGEIDKIGMQIGFVQVFIIVEGIGIDSLHERSTEMSILNEKYFKEFENLIASLENTQVNSPLFLCWALVRQSAGVDANMFGLYAIKSCVFEYLYTCINSQPFISDRNILSFVYSLVSATVTFFNEETIGDLKNVYAIANLVLRQELLAEDFWINKNGDGLGVVYESLLNYFPYKINHLLYILTSLTKAKREIAFDICSLLKNMNYLTEKLNQSTRLIYRQNTINENICILADDKFAHHYKGKELLIKAGTKGQIMTDQQNAICENLIVWAFNYNAWDIFTEEIISFLSLSDQALFEYKADQIEQTICILNFFSAQLLHFDPTMDVFTQQFNILLNAAYNITNRLYRSPNFQKELMISAFDIIIAHAKIDPFTTWKQLRSINFFSKSFIQNSSTNSGNGSIYGSILINFESVNLEFCVSDKVLQVMNYLVKPLCTSQLMDEFISAVIYIASSAFPILKNNDPTGDLQHKAIELFNDTLLSLKNANKDRESSKSEALLLDILLSREASLTLLGIVNIGVDTVERYQIEHLGYTEDVGGNPARLVSSTFALLNSLLHLNQTASILKTLFLTAIFSRTNSQTLKTIAFYTFDFSDSQLAVHAVAFLKNLAELYPLSLLSCLGDSAITFRNIILRRLISYTENTHLKVVILDFLTTCLHTQPGLFELFLNQDTADKNNLELDLLNILFTLMDKFMQGNETYPNIMLTVIIEFLHALWKSRSVALDALKKKNKLWKQFEFILYDDIHLENKLNERLLYLRMFSNLLRIISLELHYNNKLDDDFLSIVKKLFSSQRIVYFAEFITTEIQFFLTNDTNSFVLEPANEIAAYINEMSITSWQKAMIQLLSAWKEMIIVIACDSRGDILVHAKSSTGINIRDEICRNLANGLSSILLCNNEQHKYALSKYLTSAILILSKHWPCETEPVDYLIGICLNLIANDKSAFLVMNNGESFIYLFYALSIHINNQLTFGSLDAAKMLDFLRQSIQIASIISASTYSIDEKMSEFNLFKLIRSMIAMINEMTTYFNKHIIEDSDWIICFIDSPFLKNLLLAISKVEKVELDLIISVFTFIREISRNLKGGMIFFHDNLLTDISLISDQLNVKKDSSIKIELKAKERLIFQLHIEIISNLIDSAPLAIVFDFLSIYYDQLTLAFMCSEDVAAIDVVDKYDESALLEVLTVCRLLEKIGKKIKLHKMPSVYRQMLSCLCIWLQNAVFIFTQPRLISFSLEQQGPKNLIKNLKTINKSPLRHSISEDVEPYNPLVLRQQNRILCGIAHCLSVLKLISPPLPQLCLDMNFDANMYETFMNIQFSSNLLEMKNNNLSFNTFITLMNSCVDLMSKVEGARSHSPLKLSTPKSPLLVVGFNKRHLLLVIENCMLLICSHGLANLLDIKLPLKDKHLLTSEISSELNSSIMSLHRHLKCGPVSPLTTRRLSQEPMTPVLVKDHPFLVLINTINKQIFS